MDEKLERYTFYKAKCNYFILLLICLLFIVGSIVWLLETHLIAVVYIALFSYIAFHAVVTIYRGETEKKHKVFSIDEEGIIDECENISIPWASISVVRLLCNDRLFAFRRYGQSWYINVYLRDTSFLDGQVKTNSRFYKKIQKRKNYRIPLSFMEYQYEEIYKVCVYYIAKHCPQQTWKEYKIEYDVEFG